VRHVEDALAALPADWVIRGPKRTREGWKVEARPRHLLKRFTTRAVAFGNSPDQVFHNLAAALREGANLDDGDQAPPF
jgi:hypothetical protein